MSEDIFIGERSPTNNKPVLPDELWGLWNLQTGGWVPTIDESGGAQDPILVLLSKSDADLAAKRQNDLWELACVPVRLK